MKEGCDRSDDGRCYKHRQHGSACDVACSDRCVYTEIGGLQWCLTHKCDPLLCNPHMSTSSRISLQREVDDWKKIAGTIILMFHNQGTQVALEPTPENLLEAAGHAAETRDKLRLEVLKLRKKVEGIPSLLNPIDPVEISRSFARAFLQDLDEHGAKHGMEMIFEDAGEKVVVSARRVDGKTMGELHSELCEALDVKRHDEALEAIKLAKGSSTAASRLERETSRRLQTVKAFAEINKTLSERLSRMEHAQKTLAIEVLESLEHEIADKISSSMLPEVHDAYGEFVNTIASELEKLRSG